jgi:hypothetical protein
MEPDRVERVSIRSRVEMGQVEPALPTFAAQKQCRAYLLRICEENEENEE